MTEPQNNKLGTNFLSFVELKDMMGGREVQLTFVKTEGANSEVLWRKREETCHPGKEKSV